MSNRRYLCSFHIPKTGGTTFAHHARQSLGTDAFVPYGRFSNLTRFLQDEPQVEELPDDRKDLIRIVHGHGSSLRLAERMTGRSPKFAVFLRDPYARFISGFNQQVANRPKRGLNVYSIDDYVELRGDNYVATTLNAHFGQLLPSTGPVSLERAIAILQCFKYVLVTERLDRQLPELCKELDISESAIEPRRVNTAKIDPPIDRPTFERNNPVDLELYSLAAKTALPDAPLGNPFGYKPDRLLDHLNATWSKQTTETILDGTYSDLVDAAKRSNQIQAMQLKLTCTPSDHVADKQRLLRLVETALDGRLASLDDVDRSVEHFWSANVLWKARQRERAREHLDTALQLNPDNQQALKFQDRIFGKKQPAAT